MVDTRRDYVAVKVDICNAFNECGRAVTIDNFQAEPSINYLAWLAAVILAPETGLENGGGKGLLKVSHKRIFGVLCSLSRVFRIVREMCRVVRKAGGTGTLWRPDMIKGADALTLTAEILWKFGTSGN